MVYMKIESVKLGYSGGWLGWFLEAICNMTAIPQKATKLLGLRMGLFALRTNFFEHQRNIS